MILDIFGSIFNDVKKKNDAPYAKPEKKTKQNSMFNSKREQQIKRKLYRFISHQPKSDTSEAFEFSKN